MPAMFASKSSTKCGNVSRFGLMRFMRLFLFFIVVATSALVVVGVVVVVVAVSR